MGWDRPIRDSLREIQDNALEIIHETMRVATRVLLDTTPVDTGRLVGNYQPAINTEPPTFRVQNDPEKAFTKLFIFAVIDQVRLGDTLNITNATPYALIINDGTSSRIAPVKMVERAVEAARAYAASQAR